MPARYKHGNGPQAPSNVCHCGRAGYGVQGSAPPSRCQPALSRQIGDLEQEFGLKLFDRIGRRLVLTAEGGQLLGSCRSLLGHVGSLTDQAQGLRGGNIGLLKVAASPVHIESVLSTFLPQYALRYPDVQVKLIEAVAGDALAMVERGEIHLSISML